LAQQLAISIIDDDEAVRDSLVDLMKSHGYGADSFGSAVEFLNSEYRHRTQCLIADVQMPGMSGTELHDRLIALGQPIPTILITALPDDGARALALNAGVHCYLAKPFEEDELLRCIRSAITDFEGRRT
jgi:FixJ family two-component response regulator